MRNILISWFHSTSEVDQKVIHKPQMTRMHPVTRHMVVITENSLAPSLIQSTSFLKIVSLSGNLFIQKHYKSEWNIQIWFWVNSFLFQILSQHIKYLNISCYIKYNLYQMFNISSEFSAFHIVDLHQIQTPPPSRPPYPSPSSNQLPIVLQLVLALDLTMFPSPLLLMKKGWKNSP